MKLLLDIQDSKADFIIELLNNFSFVKAETITPRKAKLIKDLKQAVSEVIDAKEGNTKLESAREFLNGL